MVLGPEPTTKAHRSLVCSTCESATYIAMLHHLTVQNSSHRFGCFFACLIGSFAEQSLASSVVSKCEATHSSNAASKDSIEEGQARGSRNCLSQRQTAETEPLLGTDGAAKAQGVQASMPKNTANSDDSPKKKKHSVIHELLSLAVPDLHLTFIALTAGCVAALGSALVPYYTGLVIDYASIDPDRFGSGAFCQNSPSSHFCICCCCVS